MSIQNTVTKNTYKGDGTTRTFPYTFAMDDDHPEYIHVYITDSDGKAAETDDFTVDVKAQSVTYPKDKDESALKDGEKITIIRQLPLVQILNLVNQGPFFAEDLEQEYDDIVMMIQQLAEEVSRAVKTGLSSDETADELMASIWKSESNAIESAKSAASSEANAAASKESASKSEANAENSATEAARSAETTAEMIKEMSLSYDTFMYDTDDDALVIRKWPQPATYWGVDDEAVYPVTLVTIEA